MRGGPVAVQAAVAAGALTLAAVVWLRPPPQGAPGEVPVAPLKRGDVRAVHWDDGSHRVDVWRSPEPERTDSLRSRCGSPPHLPGWRCSRVAAAAFWRWPR